MPNCAVYGCHNHYRKTKGLAIKYYSFPKNEELCSKWIAAYRRKDNFCVDRESFGTTLQQKLLQCFPAKCRIIKRGAVPTGHLSCRDSQGPFLDKKSRRERLEKRTKKNVVREVLLNADSHPTEPQVANTSTINDIPKNAEKTTESLGHSYDHPTPLYFMYRLGSDILEKHSCAMFTKNQDSEMAEETDTETCPTAHMLQKIV
ncbi:hypothetical protein PR048_033144 [Dryococelus australis]|uniref:THAP-type domain-containing protein n=1 Tax=Dryococelus australis TaxID=614101 RepID=A0ABQ9FZF1_9NEOP|nr:hypothetical protein PR048_033144 [Dryococelus australis]